MSYLIALLVKTAIVTDERDAKNIHAAVSRALWPPEDDGAGHDSPNGYMMDICHWIESGLFRLHVCREFGDDMEVAGAKPDLHWLGLSDALSRQLASELSDASTERLAHAGLKVVSSHVDVVAMTTTYGSVFPDAGKAWEDACAAWNEGRASRAVAVEACERRKQIKLDELAYARVCARRGQPADSGWAPDLVTEYEAEAQRGIDERLTKVMTARRERVGAYFLDHLRVTLKYAEAVLNPARCP